MSENTAPRFAQLRGDEQKQRFYCALADNAVAVGIDARNLLVVLIENPRADWSFGNGVARYLANPPAPRSAQ